MNSSRRLLKKINVLFGDIKDFFWYNGFLFHCLPWLSLDFHLHWTWVQSQSNEPKKNQTAKKNNRNLINIFVLPFKAMAIMASFFFLIHMNVKEFKPKIHLSFKF
jgi:hypothetical protein